MGNLQEGMSEMGFKALWNVLTAVNTRSIGALLSGVFNAYRDTSFFFKDVEGHVALTIDDGLSRGGAETSLVPEVLKLLQQHDARCTFFVCSKYLVAEEAAAVILKSHELGNHMEEDRGGYYSKLSEEEFEASLQRATDMIESVPGAAARWFRAPQGILSEEMRRVTSAKGLRHAIGDVYCDDWKVTDAQWIAQTMLSQARPGSIIILHMPEKGYREHTLEALQLLLQGLTARGLKCTTLTDMAAKEKAANARCDTPIKGMADDSSPIPQPMSNLTETSGHGSPPSVTEPMSKLEARLGALEAHSTLRSAACDWVSTLLKGVQEHMASCKFEDDELRINLHTALTGEIATRSRVPVQFELADQIIVRFVVGDEGAVALKVSGLYFGPVGGAKECWDRLKEVWAEAGATDEASRKEVAWRWWQHDGHKKDFEGTKLWRVIESLVGLRSAHLVPTKELQDVLMGCICSTRKELRQLDCSYFYPRTSAGGISTGSPVPQVLATTQGDPANLDPSSRHYDSDSELRCQMSNSILMSHLKNPMQREMAERFFK